jgi:hypothetical protein
VHRRYSEFRELDEALQREAPGLQRLLPPLPPKTISFHGRSTQVRAVFLVLWTSCLAPSAIRRAPCACSQLLAPCCDRVGSANGTRPRCHPAPLPMCLQPPAARGPFTFLRRLLSPSAPSAAAPPTPPSHPSTLCPAPPSPIPPAPHLIRPLPSALWPPPHRLHTSTLQVVSTRKRELDCYVRALAAQPRLLACLSAQRFLELPPSTLV